MSPAFSDDLDALRGFGEAWAPDASVPEPLTALNRLLPDAEPLDPRHEAYYAREMIRLEAELVVDLLATPEGARAWETVAASDKAGGMHADIPEMLVQDVAERSRQPGLGASPLLDAAGLSRALRVLFLRHVRRAHPTLEERFVHRFDALDAARLPLVTQNIRLTLWAGAIPMLSHDESLLFGVLGLLSAIDRFNPDTGRLSTYASQWIRQSKGRRSQYCRGVVREPAYHGDIRMKWTKRLRELRASGEDPTAAELLDALDLEREKVARLYGGLPVGERLAAAGVGGASRLCDLRVEEAVADRMLEDALSDDWAFMDALLEPMKARPRHILRARLGLVDGEMRTLEVVGQAFNVTRERIRQIQNKAIESIHRRAAALRKLRLRRAIAGDISHTSSG